MNSKSAITILLMVLMMVLAVAGCTPNKSKMDDTGIYTQTDTANYARLHNGNMELKGGGAGPSGVNMDDIGTYAFGNVPLGSIHFQIPNFIDPNSGLIKGDIVSPGDVKIAHASFSYNPATGIFAVEITGLESNKSPVITAQGKAMEAALVVLDSMVKTEAEAAVKRWEIAGTFGSEALSVLKTFIGLKFPATP